MPGAVMTDISELARQIAQEIPAREVPMTEYERGRTAGQDDVLQGLRRALDRGEDIQEFLAKWEGQIAT